MRRVPGIRIMVALALAGCLLGCLAWCLAGCASNGDQNPNEQKEVSDVQQLDIHTTRQVFAEIGEETGHGGYGEYTEITLEGKDHDALRAVLDARNKEVATQLVATVTDHANDPNAQTTTESHALDVALGGVDNSVEAVDFINFVTSGAVTRSDTNLTCLLETRVSEIDGWGKKMYFASNVYDSATGAELKLGDLVTDTSQLPALIDEALRTKYCFEDMIGEDEDPAAVVRGKLDDPAANGELAWTADYLGMKFYFDSSDFSHANSYQGMYVSLPYADHPGLFAEACTAVPDDFIAQLEYGVAYELPGDAQGRAVRITRTRRDDATLGLLDPTPSLNAGWTFAVQVGTGTGDSFTPTSEATSSPWFYDTHRQDYMPSLVRVDGNWYVYGFGDRNSDNYPTAVFKLGAEVELVKEFDEGFAPSAPYTSWAFPCNPAAVTMADRDCLASYDRITFERACSIDDATGLPLSEEDGYRAHTVNEAYKMRIEVNGELVDDGRVGDATAIPEGAACFLVGGIPHERYDMELADGRVVRLAYDAQTHKIDGHYTADIMSMVPAASAATAQVETGPRKRTAWQHGREVTLIPETGNIVGTGAIIDYGDTPWWIAEEFVGTWKATDEDRAAMASWYSDGNAPSDGELVIREDGTLSFTFGGRTFEGALAKTRGWGVYAVASVTPVDGGNTQDAWFDYTSESESDRSWSRINFHVQGLPYPMYEESPDIACFLTRS